MKRSCLLIVVIVGLLCLVGCKRQIDLNQYISINVEGFNAHGKVDISFDYDAFVKKAGKIQLNEAKIDPVELAYYKLANGTDYVEKLLWSLIDYQVQSTKNLSNGDTVQVVWCCEDEKMKDLFGINLKHTDVMQKVDGLKELPTFDLFSAIEVEYSGKSPYGDAEVVVKDSALAEDISFYLDKNDVVSNGDVIHVTAAIKTSEEQYISKHEKFPIALEKEYIVSGMEEIEYIDIFEYMNFNLTGASPHLSASVSSTEDNIGQDVRFSLDRDKNLKNGDVITSTVELKIPEKQFAEKYGCLPESLTKEHTVQGATYITDASQFRPEDWEKMKEHARDIIAADQYGEYQIHGVRWNSIDTEYIGYIFKEVKGGYEKEFNCYYRIELVYKVEADITATVIFTKKNMHLSFYYVLPYPDLYINEEGEMPFDPDNHLPAYPNVAIDYDTGLYGGTVRARGFKTLEDLHYDRYEIRIDKFIMDEKIEGLNK